MYVDVKDVLKHCVTNVSIWDSGKFAKDYLNDTDIVFGIRSKYENRDIALKE